MLQISIVMSLLLWTNNIVMGNILLLPGKKEQMDRLKTSKVTLSQGSDALLNKMVERTNEGFDGKVTKHEELSWIVRFFHENYFERNLDRIRNDHFDHVVHLENLLKRVKQARHKGAQDSEAENRLKQMVDAPDKSREKQPRLTKARVDNGSASGD